MTPTPPDNELDAPRRGPSGPTLIALVIALIFLAGVIGWRIGDTTGDDQLARDSVDVGFFQDMSTHHNQAVSMGFEYLAHGTDPLLRQIAGEIVTYQSSEIGVMGEYLTQWGQLGTEPETAMSWMGMTTRRDEMLGLATSAQMTALAKARGAALDQLFTRLVIEHHAGGVHMAEYAERHAQTSSAKRWAHSIDDGQRGEIAELNRWRVQHGLAAVITGL